MPPKKTSDGVARPQRYRKQRQHRGMRLLRIWVPDPRRPDFVAAARRQGLILRGQPEEVEALDFIAATTELSEA